jgi:hypothetical protein
MGLWNDFMPTEGRARNQVAEGIKRPGIEP